MGWGELGEEVAEVEEGVEPGYPMWGDFLRDLLVEEEQLLRRMEEVDSAWWLEVLGEL